MDTRFIGVGDTYEEAHRVAMKAYTAYLTTAYVSPSAKVTEEYFVIKGKITSIIRIHPHSDVYIKEGLK